MDVVLMQHRNSDGHKSKSTAIVFSSYLDNFEVNSEVSDDVGASEIAEIYHEIKQSFIHFA